MVWQYKNIAVHNGTWQNPELLMYSQSTSGMLETTERRSPNEI